MNTRLLKLLREQIEEIEKLGDPSFISPEYDLWKNTTSKIVRNLFGQEYLNIFEELTAQVKRDIRLHSEGNQMERWRQEKIEKTRRLLEGFIKEKERIETELSVAIGKTLGLSNYDLHLSIKNVSQNLFEDRHYAEAVEAGCKEVIKRVRNIIKQKTNKDLDGDNAMGHAFGCENREPLVKFNNLQTREEKGEQKGIMFLFKGIVGIRNRKAHENITLNNPYRAIEYLTLTSLLMRLLDEYGE